jgi:uncharacterized protein (TIGR00255 family)
MITSMTGYGKGISGDSNFSAEAEIKSINSRYLEVFLKFPPVLSNREYDIRELLRKKINRGKISLSISLKYGKGESNTLVIDEHKLKDFLTTVKQIKKKVKLTDKIKLDHILDNRDLLQSDETVFSDEQFNYVKTAINGAVDQLLKMKKDEGNELAKDLKKRVWIIESKISEIEAQASEAVEDYFNKQKERVKLLLGDSTIDQDRMNTELAFIADRSEVTEECVRLRSHIKFFQESIQKDDEPGRKLNFLCQEMNREANTISSKSISIPITHNVVLIKEEIEKIREQIQNIE